MVEENSESVKFDPKQTVVEFRAYFRRAFTFYP